MDVQTGRIYYDDHIQNQPADVRKRMVQMVVPPTAKQVKRMRVGRNDPCPCGSGKKFKVCCKGTLP